jgi:plasmid stability protein
MATLQVRDIDSELYDSLKKRAAGERRSISQEVVGILESHLRQPKALSADSTKSFLALCDSWHDDRTAKEIAKDLRKHRKQSSRFRGDHGIFD